MYLDLKLQILYRVIVALFFYFPFSFYFYKTKDLDVSKRFALLQHTKKFYRGII